jgi:hypothetical protein
MPKVKKINQSKQGLIMQITPDHFTIIDEQDEGLLYARHWWIAVKGRHCYVVGKVNHKNVKLHRIIARAREGEIVDHINRNSLDNRRSNLRKCTRGQNVQNTKPWGVSPFRGVNWSKRARKWTSEIMFKGHRYWLGYFSDEILAALTYDCAADRLYGPIGFRNFSNLISEDVARELIVGIQQKIFSVIFYKRTESLSPRHMLCRSGVHKNSNGGRLSFDPREHDLLSVYDMVKKAHRFINLTGLLLVAAKGEKWRVQKQLKQLSHTADMNVHIAEHKF